MVIEFGEAEILEGQVTHPVDRVVDAGFAVPNLLQ
jgi:hypothetical protein